MEKSVDYNMYLQIFPFSPNHLIDDSGVALDDLYDLGAEAEICIIRNRGSGIICLIHFNSQIHRLKQSFCGDAGDNKGALVQCFRTFGGGSDAHGCQRMAAIFFCLPTAKKILIQRGISGHSFTLLTPWRKNTICQYFTVVIREAASGWRTADFRWTAG